MCGPALRLAVPAGVALGDLEAEFLEFGDELAQALVVVEPGLVVGELVFGLVAGALAKDEPNGLPSPDLAGICDALLEASVPPEFKDASSSLAVDWTDLESFSRPPPARGGDCADPEASWGHRKDNLAARRTSCSSATTCRPRSWSPASRARPFPSSPAA